MSHIFIFFLTISVAKSAIITGKSHNRSRRRNIDIKPIESDLVIVNTDRSPADPNLIIINTEQTPTENYESTSTSTLTENAYDLLESDVTTQSYETEEISVEPRSKWKRYSPYIAISGSVLFLTIVIYGLWRNALCSMSILLCPCIVIAFPCLYFHFKSFDPVKQMKRDPNKYLPGLIISDDCVKTHYSPTPEEMYWLADVINKIETV